MLSFIVSVLVTLGAAALGVMLLVIRHRESLRDPTEGMATWEALNGKAWRALNEHQDAMDTSFNWAVSLFIFSAASAFFAVVKGVMLWGG